ncbi:PREDICTED: uncharacterized protein LOC106790369 [Polistes canadensis]|uniref:uncharacterized protein LOC106790369 n=1 Tax=Polistes canadensis TaxID=91411 RepID=UPI000718EDE1|nr:PREDICTED: uncharacterized protein LOC106790369 [Polistes canadensis]
MELINNQNWKQNFDFCTIDYPNDNCTKPSSYDCPFNLHNNCTWNINKWTFVNSLNKPMGPVLDNRWEGFSEFDNFKSNSINQNKYNHINKLAKTNSIVFSVRAAAEVQALLCDGEDYTNSFCYWIIIGGLNNTISTIRKCPKGFSLEYQIEKTNCFMITNNTIDKLLLNPNEWKHFVLKWDNVTRRITLYNENKIILNYVDENLITNDRDNYCLFYYSSESILIRNHIYNYIYTNKLNNTLTSPEILYENNPSLCFEFSIGLCKNCIMKIIMTAFNRNKDSNEKNTMTVKGSKEIYELTTFNETQPFIQLSEQQQN